MPASLVTNLLMTNRELENVGNWRYKVSDKSLSSKTFDPFWDWLVRFVPNTVAPNTLTMMALVCVLQAYWVVEMHSHEFPKITTCIAGMLTYGYFTLSALDHKHAERMRNDSAICELFEHGVDNIGLVFQILTFLTLTGVTDPATRWYVVQTGQLIVLSTHISPFNSQDKTWSCRAGRGAVLHACILVMIIDAAMGLSFVWDGYVHFLQMVELYLPLGEPHGTAAHPNGAIPPHVFWHKGVKLLYSAAQWRVVTQILFMSSRHNRSRAGLLFCIFLRIVPAIVMEYTTRWDALGGITPVQLISDGLFLSIPISDIIVAKVADRELHHIVVLMSMCSICSNFMIYFSLFMYYVVVLLDICQYNNLPLFTPMVNVYCDGVFDMLHLGHMNQFRQAMEVSGGTRLFVGVHSDEDCAPYKRLPIMKEQERYAAVRACKYVHEVIEGAPMVATKEYIEKHNLHIYAIGEEYASNPKDHYYKVPRELGMIRPTKRTMGVSTSDLIDRISQQRPELLKRKQEAATVPGSKSQS